MENNGQNMAQRLHQAEVLLNISRKVAATETLDEVLHTLVEITTTEIGAERGSLFLNDTRRGELYSRVAQGNLKREIRLLNTSGIAGQVFTSGQGLIVQDVETCEFFNKNVDEQTGFKTQSVLCAPVRTIKGELIGVVQALNKLEGPFNEADLALLEAMATQAAISLQAAQYIEQTELARKQELKFLEIVSDITSEIDLNALLQKVMNEATRMLKADRSTLFLNDEKTNELWSVVGQGLDAINIRFPNHLGIAGTVFTSGKTICIPHAYADLRFNPAVDKQTGYFTRSILCVPVVTKEGKIIGVTQALNKSGGVFTAEDESRLKAFTGQVSIALENAKLFDNVQNMKNYSESMLESMSNGVITLDEDGKIATCNAAAERIMRVTMDEIEGVQAEAFFVEKNAWIQQKVSRVEETQEMEITMDAELVFAGDTLSVNVTVLPLISVEKKKLGQMIMLEDISSEKRMKSTMSRYMDPDIAEQLMAGGEDVLGGCNATASVLFSDVRSFTTLTEELGPQGTVHLLNEYFTLMVECISKEGGMLDKFIGDAIMAAFGIPIGHEDDEDRAVRAAIAMLVSLREFNAARASDGKPPVDMGIGINTDTVVSGNIGSPKRMDYTVIGDGVNLAARLESACKQYSAHLLLSEYTARKLRGTYRLREIDHVVVKGKTEPVGVFEVLDYHTEETFPNLMDTVSYFNEGRNLYRKGAWDKAIEAFKEALSLNPMDKLSQTYIERCSLLKEKPPEGQWNGIWVMTSK